MPELNGSERRALRLAAVLVLLGTAARLGLGPGESAHAWRSDPPGAEAGAGLDSLRGRVEGNLARARRAATPLAPGERIDPNVADPAELDRLPGVGPATARAIIEHRGRRRFRRRGDLLAVRGIGPATLRRMAPHLALPRRPEGGVRSVSDAGARRAPGRGGSAREDPPPTPGAPVDLNRATAVELRALPGVGPVLAAEIIAWRSRRGGFGTVEELMEVRGIGPVKMERLRPLVRVR